MATLYVDYKNGVDTNDGSSGSPLKTISHTLSSHAGNNDVIKLRGSTSDATTFFREMGLSTSLTGLTIEADTGNNPVWVGSDAYTSWSKTGGRTNVYQAAYSPGNCWFVWNGATRLTSVADVGTCDSTTNSYYFDNANDLLYVNIGGSAPSTIEVVTGNAYGLDVNGSGCTFNNLIMQYWFQPALNLDAGATVDGCTIRYHGNWGGDSFAGIRVNASSATISDCTITMTADKDSAAGVQCIGLASGDSLTVSNCTLTNASMGIVLMTGTGHVIDGCTIGEMYDGINTYLASAGATISFTLKNSTITNCGHGILTARHTTTATIHHNTFYHTENQGGNGYGLIFHNGGTSQVYHNVFDDLNLSTNGHGIYFAPMDGNTLTINARNNIFLNCDNAIYYQSGTVTYAALDYNCFYGNTNNYSGVDAGDQGDNDVADDPDFTNAAAHTYTLLAGSPCINTGVAIEGINDGYSGAAPDIGRYEVVITEVNKSEGITLAETVLASISDLAINQSEGVTLGETAEAELGAVTDQNISVTDNLTLGETVAVSLSALEVSAIDNATLGEDVTVTLPEIGVFSITVSDPVILGETVTASMGELGILIDPSVLSLWTKAVEVV